MLQLVKTFIFLEAVICVASLFLYWAMSARVRKELGNQLLILSPLIPAILSWSPSFALLHIFGLLVVALAARKSEEVAGLYAFTILMVPGFSFPFFIGSFYLFHLDLHMTIGLGALIALLIKFPPKRRGLLRFDLPFAIFFVLLVIPYVRGDTATNGLRLVVQHAIVYAVPYYVVSRSIRSWDGARRFALYLTCAAAIIACILLFEARKGWQLYSYLYPIHGIELTVAQNSIQIRFGLMRAVGPFLEATSMAFAMMLCTFAAFATRRYFRSSAAYAALMGLLLIGILAPQSRGAWIGLVIGLVCLGLYRRKYWLPAATASFAALLLAIAVASPTLSEALGITGSASATVEYREKLYERGMEEFWKTPIIGDSRNAVYAKLNDMQQGQGIIDFVNTYLYVALVTGAIGVALFLFTLAKPAFDLWRLRPRLGAVDEELTLAGFVFAGLVAPIEMLAFTSFGGRAAILVICFMGLAAVLLRTVERRGAAPAPAKRRPLFPDLAPGPVAINSAPGGAPALQAGSTASTFDARS